MRSVSSAGNRSAADGDFAGTGGGEVAGDVAWAGLRTARGPAHPAPRPRTGSRGLRCAHFHAPATIPRGEKTLHRDRGHAGTLKLKRRVVHAKYADVIDALYEG